LDIAVLQKKSHTDTHYNIEVGLTHSRLTGTLPFELEKYASAMTLATISMNLQCIK